MVGGAAECSMSGGGGVIKSHCCVTCTTYFKAVRKADCRRASHNASFGMLKRIALAIIKCYC
jgi:hypothetical protein